MSFGSVVWQNVYVDGNGNDELREIKSRRVGLTQRTL